MLGTTEAVLPCIATCGKPVRLVEASYLQLVMQGTVVLLHLGTFIYAHKISANDQLSRIQFAAAERRSMEYKNLHQAMKAYIRGTETVFRDIFLIGYR